MSRRYETVYIFDGALDEAQVNTRLEKFHALLTKDGKGTITNVSHWGKRTLAYRLKKRESAYYAVAQYEVAPELLVEYERAVKLDESVLRFLVVIAEEPARPAPAVVAAAAEEDEIEEDDA
jgi:small subunit ribosomal protein S6